MSAYIPQTILASGAPWPPYKPSLRAVVKDKVKAPKQPKPPKPQFVGSTALIMAYLKENRWATCYQIARALRIEIKVVATRAHYYEAKGLLMAKKVPSVRGTALGYLINPDYKE